MFSDSEQVQFQNLQDRQSRGEVLSSEETEELKAMIRRIDERENAYLGPANDRLRAENAAAGERINALAALAKREEQFLARLESILAELQAERNAVIAERRRLLAHISH